MNYRKLFVTAALSVAAAAGQDCVVNFKLNSAGTSSVFDNRTKGCVTWAVTYTGTGFSALSLTVQGAADSSGSPGAFGTVTAVAGLNPNTAVSQASSTFATYFPWMRVALSGLTGAGSVTGTLYGWRIGAQAGASGGGGGGGGGAVWGPDAPGVAPTQPPVQGGIFDGTNVRRLLGTSAGRLVNQPKTVSLALADAFANTQPAMQGDDAGGTVPVYPAFNFAFNGSTWDRMRGGVNGIFAQGPAASGSAAAGNPILIGGRESGGNVRSIFTDSNGYIFLGGNSSSMADGSTNSPNQLFCNGTFCWYRVGAFVFNGSTWDRMRGNATAGLQVGGLGSGAAGTLYGMTACDSSAQVTVSSGSTTEIVALVASRRIRVCSYQVTGGNTNTTGTFVQGTGTNCGTGTANLSPSFTMLANYGYTRGSGIGELFATTAGNALCLTSSGGATAVWVSYAIY
jgi:hypothetical protein